MEQLLSRLQDIPPPRAGQPELKDKLFHSVSKQPWLWNRFQVDGGKAALMQGSQQLSPGKKVKRVWSEVSSALSAAVGVCMPNGSGAKRVEHSHSHF